MSQEELAETLGSIFAREIARRSSEGEVVESGPTPDRIEVGCSASEAVRFHRLIEALEGCDEKDVIGEIERLADQPEGGE